MPKSIGPSVWLLVGVFLASLMAVPSGTAEAREGTKTLKLYFGHTKERGEFTFKRNGRYDKKEITRLNRFLRDWRRNEPANMDPQLLDLVWAIYKESGSKDYINVVSAYRSPATNKMLRSRSRGVAEKSQHTLGKAMDWYVTDVPLAKLRATAMRMQGGGVGYYPTSGSPFVHTDTGNVRAWPRMSRKQLIALFPKGDTLHLPADGKPLPGYEKAVARRKSTGKTELAYLDVGSDEATGGGKGGWLKRVFSGGADKAEDDEESGTAIVAAPAPIPEAPIPQAPVAAVPAPTIVDVPPAPSVEPATGEPQMLIAGDETMPETRLPRARPSSDTAELPPPAGIAVAPEDGSALASLTAAPPPPRQRPDPELLAGTLDPDAVLVPLSVEPEDAIAALAAVLPSDAPVPPPEPAATVPALAEAAAPAAPAEGGASDGLTAIAKVVAPDDAAAAPVPRPRPVALAFAGSGLPRSEPVTDPAAAPRLATKGDRNRIAAIANDASIPERTPITEPSAAAIPEIAIPEIAVPEAAIPEAATQEPDYGTDSDELGKMIAAPAPSPASKAFNGFSMPQPTAAPDLFAAPATAASVAAPGPAAPLPTGRFAAAAATQAQAKESFLSKLFASLAE